MTTVTNDCDADNDFDDRNGPLMNAFADVWHRNSDTSGYRPDHTYKIKENIHIHVLYTAI